MPDSNEPTLPDLSALADDEGFVITIMLSTLSGLFVRNEGAWHLLTDPDPIDGLNFTFVKYEAVDVFDTWDRQGQLVQIANYPEIGDLDSHDEIGGPFRPR